MIKIEKNEIGGACSTQGERRGVCKVLLRRAEGKRSFGRPGVDGRVILKSIFKKWGGKAWTGLRMGTGGGHL